MTVIAQLILFLSSYVPLFIFMTILDTFGTASGEIATTVLSISSLIMLLYMLHHTKRLAPQELKIRTTKSRDGDVITYIVTYILPFTLTNPQNGREKLTLILLIALICFLYIKLLKRYTFNVAGVAIKPFCVIKIEVLRSVVIWKSLYPIKAKIGLI